MNRSVLFLLLLLPVFSLAHTVEGQTHESTLNKAKLIIDSNVPCENLTREDLEIIGDYYMEQMHPGEQHEMMDAMMGGEGSESLKNAHIAMAERIYCARVSPNYTMSSGGFNMGPGMGLGYASPMYYGPSIFHTIGIFFMGALTTLILVLIWREWKGSQ